MRNKLFCVTSCFLLFLAACSGGGNGIDTSADLSQYILTTYPENGATDINPRSNISVTFATNIDASTITEESFSVSDSNGALKGAVNYDASSKTAIFTPSPPLKEATSYVVTLSSTIVPAEKSAVVTDYTWSFTTKTRTWSEPRLIDNTDKIVTGAVTAINSNGDSVLCWLQEYESLKMAVWASIYTEENGWGEPAQLEYENRDSDDYLYFPPFNRNNIGIDAGGNVIVLWSKDIGIANEIWSNIYTADLGWADTFKLSDNGDHPLLAMNAAGDAIAVWVENNDVIARRYIPGEGWSSQQIIDSSDEGALFPQAGLDASGNVIVIWGQYYNIWANRNEPQTDWGKAELIENTDADAYSPRLSIDSNGNAVAAWTLRNYSVTPYEYGLMTNRYDAENGWNNPEYLLDHSNNELGISDIAMDDAGNILSIWGQRNEAAAFWDVWTNDFTNGIGWGENELLENNDIYDVYLDDLAMNQYGEAIAVWTAFDGTVYNGWMRRFTPEHGWSGLELIETDDGGDVVDINASINQYGEIIVAWTFFDRTEYNIWAKLYK